jgi:peptide/nickel transport system substrate-binding protein
LDFTANPYFFLGAPKLRRIVVRIIPDEDTAVNALRTGDIDWMFQASEDNYPKISGIPSIVSRWVDLNGYEYITLNVTRPYLRDVRVRRAIAYAIDKTRLIRRPVSHVPPPALHWRRLTRRS